MKPIKGWIGLTRKGEFFLSGGLGTLLPEHFRVYTRRKNAVRFDGSGVVRRVTVTVDGPSWPQWAKAELKSVGVKQKKRRAK